MCVRLTDLLSNSTLICWVFFFPHLFPVRFTWNSFCYCIFKFTHLFSILDLSVWWLMTSGVYLSSSCLYVTIGHAL